MPYRRIEDLPRVQVAPYDERQQEAFLKAFNLAWATNGGDEGLAFAAAHDAARRAGGDTSGLAAGLWQGGPREDAPVGEEVTPEDALMPASASANAATIRTMRDTKDSPLRMAGAGARAPVLFWRHLNPAPPAIARAARPARD